MYYLESLYEYYILTIFEVEVCNNSREIINIQLPLSCKQLAISCNLHMTKSSLLYFSFLQSDPKLDPCEKTFMLAPIYLCKFPF